MAQIAVVDESAAPEEPVLVEGFPGVGLVGKIAADHLVDAHDMRHYANVHCEGLPRAAVYRDGDAALTTPVRIHADIDSGLAVLQTDVPVTPSAAAEFGSCLAGWFDDVGAFPVFCSGLSREDVESPRGLYGVSTGDGDTRLDTASVSAPPETGIVSGPTGALLADALERGRDAAGLIVESESNFPDPEAAKTLIEGGIDPIAGTETPTDELLERATEIRRAKREFAERMQAASNESSQADPLKMYQ